jgi:uroporphyrin-3 C-methyltransferase
MQDPNPPTEPATGQPAVAHPASTRSRQAGGPRRSVVLAIVVVLLVAIAAVWLDARHDSRVLRTDIAQRLAAIESSATASKAAQTQLASDVRDAQAKLTLLETRLAESQAQQGALEALYRDLAPSRDEIALTEIEQVLLVASQQLQLAGNVQSALAALQLADAKLQRLDRPQFLPLRRALARDIDRLKAVPFVDISGISVKLDQASAAVPSLPLARDERLPAPPAAEAPPKELSQWQRFLRDAWGDIRQMVRIEVSDRPAAPLIAPSQEYYVRENLRLRLLSARIAVLSRDDASFKSDLAAADEWLKQYFDTRAKSVQVVQATVKQLASSPMPGGAPDLSASLDALRVLRLAQDRAPVRPPERVR